MNLINTTAGAVNWGVDTSNAAPDGRSSIRLTSKKSYDSGLVVIDVNHMPTGCGTWPAFWMVGPDWPNKYARYRA
jgi:beta-glucanase (GH16 family)